MPKTQTVAESTHTGTDIDDEPLLTIAEVAARLRLSPWSVRELCKTGKLEVMYLGPKTIRVKPSVLRDYIEGLPTTRPEPANA